MERYHIFKLGLAILFYAAYCIRPMLVNGLRSMNKTEMGPEDYLVYYQVQDGIPGVDFPILSNIPRTTFSCQNIDSGYYADLDTDCQVFHICEEGKKISFLCPNGTIFDQSDLICEWWFKVNCSNSPSLYQESAELLREDLAKRKASRKVYLDGEERKHGAVMRVEESSSISARKGSKSFSPAPSNVITNNRHSRISQESQKSESSSHTIDRNLGQLDHLKNKRYNDADTGNYVNKVDDHKKDLHVQFSETSPGLHTASSERHVRVRLTTPSSLNSVSFDQDQHMKNGNRGRTKFRASFGTDESSTTTVTSTDEYDLQFPKHRSEIANENISGSRTSGSPTNVDFTKLELGVQAALKGTRPSDSDELQIPQETAAFAKNSYNELHTTRKQATINPYPNHRPTYSNLKKPTLPTPRFLGGINSVTPQYITTQPINNGKPFVGSTVGLNIYGTKLRTTTLAPETSPFGRHISSTFNSIISTTQVPLIESSTKRIIDHATVYGSYKTAVTTPTPSGGVEIKFGKNENKVAKSVRDKNPKYGSAVNPPFLKSDDVVHINDLRGTIPSSTVSSGVSSDSDGLSGIEGFRGSTTASPKSHIRVLDNAVARENSSKSVKTYFPSTTVKYVQSTTDSVYTISSSSSPKFSTTDKGFGYQSTTGRNSLSGSVEGNTLSSIIPPQVELASGQNSVGLGIGSEGGSGILLKPIGAATEIKNGGADSFSGTTAKPLDVLQESGGSTLKPATHLQGSTVVPPVSIASIGSGTAGKGAGLSVNGLAISGGSSNNIGSSNRNVPVITSSPVATASPSDGGAIYEVFTEPTELSSGYSVGTTTIPFSGVSRGKPFESSPQTIIPTNFNKAIGYTQSPGSQQEIKIIDSSIHQVAHQGSPFKTNEGASEIVTPTPGGTIYEVFTEHTQSATGKPVSTTIQPTIAVTNRGRPFQSSEYSSESPQPTLSGLISTDTTQSPIDGSVTHRGRPFKTSQEATETQPIVEGHMYEVFTERAQLEISTTDQSLNAVTLRGEPFKLSDAVGGGRTEYKALTENLQTSTGQPIQLSRTSGGEVLKYGSAVKPPLLTPDAFVHVSNIKNASSSAESIVSPNSNNGDLGDVRSLPSGGISEVLKYSSTVKPPHFGDINSTSSALEITVAPNIDNGYLDGRSPTSGDISEVPKYGSAVQPPLLTSDAFVHVSDIKSTSSSVEGTVSQASNNGDLEDIRSPESESKLTYFVSSTAAPLKATTRPHGSTVVPLLSQDLVVHSNIPSTSRPEKDALRSNYNSLDLELNPINTQSTHNDTFGNKINPTIITLNNVHNVKLFAQGVSEVKPAKEVHKYGGFNRDINRPKDILQVSHNGDINISGSTLAPEVVSFSGSLKSAPVVPPLSASNQNSISLTVSSHGGKIHENPGFYVTKNSVYGSPTSTPPIVSSTVNYERSTPFVNVIQHSGEGGIEPPQATLSAPKVESTFEKEVPLVKSESQWPRPFQRPNSLRGDNKERATYLPTESTTSTFVTYQISSARPFMLPESTSAPTVPTPFRSVTPPQTSVYENVDNMINILKEIVNTTDHDYSSETPRPGLIVPPSAGPQTLHTLAVYFANALDGIAAEREKQTGEELDEESKEKLTSLLTQMTMYRYKELFKGNKEENGSEGTTMATDLEDDSDNLIESPGLKQLARNFSLALSSYLDDPEAFRRDLESLRPTEPPHLIEDTTEAVVGDEELLNFSDADIKPSFPPAFSTLPSVSPTWGYILAPKGSQDLNVKNSLNPDLHTADTQSFVPGFNNLPVSASKKSEDKKGLPEDHWTVSPGATKLWQSAFSVNLAIVNDQFVTTEPTLLEAESTDGYVEELTDLPRFDVPQSEVRYDLRALPKISLNTTEVRGLLIDFINTTKADESNRLQRLLRKLNTTEIEFLTRMKEIESNPLTKRLVLLLISECGTNATRDIAEHELSKETLESSQTSSVVASYNKARHNSDIPELVDSSLQNDDQDRRALQLLNSLYTIAAKFGK